MLYNLCGWNPICVTIHPSEFEFLQKFKDDVKEKIINYRQSNEKENAIEEFRTLIGATNPAEAAEGTIRKKYATSIGENAVHGSDSDENAAIESAFHFAGREQF